MKAILINLDMIILAVICLGLAYSFSPSKIPEGWRFWHNDTSKEFRYPKDFVDKEVLKHHPNNYKEFWKVRGVENWERVERIYKNK